MDNLLAAWREFLCGKRRRKDVAGFSLHLMDRVVEIHHELTDRSYRHGGYREFKVNDPKQAAHMGKLAKRRFQTQYSVDEHMRKILQVYQDLK